MANGLKYFIRLARVSSRESLLSFAHRVTLRNRRIQRLIQILISFEISKFLK